MKIKKIEIFLFLGFILFSLWLMFSTFGSKDNNLLISAKIWSDFSLTVPIIRSFSLGSNFPPEFPLFAGYPIKYHFGFFMVVGLLERIGIPLHFALNLLSALGFSLLLVLIYYLTIAIFKKRLVGFISVSLFLFNGSFSFLEFFKSHPINPRILYDIIQNNTFPSFGPYDGKIVSAFWNLNIYTNQRHLALAYTSFLLLILIIYKSSQKPKMLSTRNAVLFGIIIGFFPFIHLPTFGSMGLTLLLALFLFPKIWKKIVLIGAIAITIAVPQIIYMGAGEVGTNIYNPGYLVERLTILGFTKYWFLNLGLTSILAPLGFLLANKKQRKIFIPFLVLFIIGNLFQFSVEIAANHKFFNLSLIGLNMFTAYFIYKIWILKKLGKITSLLLILPLTLSGIIDLFPIINDRFLTLQDIPNNKAATFIYENTPKDAVFLNAMFLYDPASLAGRRIYLGWPYFAWSAGYQTTQRHEMMKNILASSNKATSCQKLGNENIDYLEIQNPTLLEDVSINYSFFEKNFIRIYFDESVNISIYDVGLSCK